MGLTFPDFLITKLAITLSYDVSLILNRQQCKLWKRILTCTLCSQDSRIHISWSPCKIVGIFFCLQMQRNRNLSVNRFSRSAGYTATDAWSALQLLQWSLCKEIELIIHIFSGTQWLIWTFSLFASYSILILSIFLVK